MKIKSGVSRKPPPTPNTLTENPTTPPRPSRTKTSTDTSAIGKVDVHVMESAGLALSFARCSATQRLGAHLQPAQPRKKCEPAEFSRRAGC